MPRTLLAKISNPSHHGARVIVGISMLVMVSAILLAAQHLLDARQAEGLRRTADRVLAHSVTVADQSTTVLEHAAAIDLPPCSHPDIDAMRLLGFESKFVRDVGRLQAGRVVCSAAWGVLEVPLQLPAPEHGMRGYRFWRSTAVSPVGEVRADVTAQGSIFVVTAPGSFDDIGLNDPSVRTLVTTRDRVHVFQAFNGGESMVVPWQERRLSEVGLPMAWTCHAVRSICVVVSQAHTWLWSEPLWLLIGLAALGMLSGAGLGLILGGYVSKRRSRASQLRRAIEGGTIRLAYQPIRVLASRQMLGVEALARWTSEEGHEVPPDEFIPLAEKNGLIEALTHGVVRRACDELGDRLRDGSGFYVSVNVPPQQLIDPAFERFLVALAHEFRIPASAFALEVTERSTARVEDLAASLQRLRAHGFKAMIDDFGTGYSSLAYLADLPLDAIKMDRAFTRAVGTRSLASGVIESICAIATALQVDLVIEGIETEEQAAYLLALHPNARGQGWLLGRPMPAEQLPG